MQIKLIAGRQLPESPPLRDTIVEYGGRQYTGRIPPAMIQVLLNRAAVDYLEMTPEEAIGKRIFTGLNVPAAEVCGVVENFNFESLHHPIGGFCIHNSPYEEKAVIRIRLKEGVDVSKCVETFGKLFEKHFPEGRYEPRFPDLQIAEAYDSERRTGRVAIVFSVLAIFVACMGVFGLTAFMAEQRTKEIGIRKVLGGSIRGIVSLFSTSYIKLLLISLVIAIPVAWWIGNQYLQDFAYRISLHWWMFAVAPLITIVLALLTVSGIAIKAATKNPVEAIKSE